MAKIERIWCYWSKDVQLNLDSEPYDMLRAKYSVEGRDDVMVCLMWLRPGVIGDELGEAAALATLDGEAQYNADHPDEAPKGHLVWD